MSLVSVRAALEIAVNNMLPSLSTDWDNDSFKPVAGIAWQRVSLLTGHPENQVMDTSFKENGILRISLFYPLRNGAALIAERVDLIRSVFPRDTRLTSDGVTVVTVGTPEKISERVDEGWFSSIVDIRFYSEIS